MTKEEQITITSFVVTSSGDAVSVLKIVPVYEDRMIKVESAINHLLNDTKEIKAYLRWILGLIFAFGSIILGLMAHGFKWF